MPRALHNIDYRVVGHCVQTRVQVSGGKIPEARSVCRKVQFILRVGVTFSEQQLTQI